MCIDFVQFLQGVRCHRDGSDFLVIVRFATFFLFLVLSSCESGSCENSVCVLMFFI